MHDLVALLEEMQAQDSNTARPLLLLRGQIVTVVMIYPDGARAVKFAGRDGRAYALLSTRLAEGSVAQRWFVRVAHQLPGVSRPVKCHRPKQQE